MSFSYEELAEIRYYIHQHPELSGQEYQTTAFLKERLEELGIRILESGLKTGLLQKLGPTNRWWHFEQISMPFQFWNQTKSALQKSESRSHACMWP